jgi:hypothetical protein
VDGLQADALRHGQRGQLPGAQRPDGDEVAEEVVPDLRPGVALEGEAGAQSGERDVGVGGREAIEDLLLGGLVDAVVRAASGE